MTLMSCANLCALAMAKHGLFVMRTPREFERHHPTKDADIYREKLDALEELGALERERHVGFRHEKRELLVVTPLGRALANEFYLEGARITLRRLEDPRANAAWQKNVGRWQKNVGRLRSVSASPDDQVAYQKKRIAQMEDDVACDWERARRWLAKERAA